MNASQLFSTIYREDRWNGGSGPGSDVAFCRPLAAWLAAYVNENGIGSVVDFGCGDFRWMPEVLDRTGVAYVGLDVVEGLVERHSQAHPRWSFATLDVSTAAAEDIPRADLYWAKDALQHWPSDTITAFLDRFFAARPDARLVVCNCSDQGRDERTLDARWHFAPLSGTRPPLAAFSPELLFAWGGKHVYRLHHRSAMIDLPTSDRPPT